MRNILSASILVVAFSSTAYAQQTTCAPSLSAFQQLRTGMSYGQAVAIIGCEGSELSRTEMAGYVTVMYMWSSSWGANMNAMFQNDGLVSKAQFGLK